MKRIPAFLYKVSALLAAAVLCAGLFAAQPVKAETTTPGGLPTSTAPSSGASFAVTGTAGGRYAPPPTQQSLNARIQTAYISGQVCLITQDPAYGPGAKSGSAPTTADVMYDNNKYANVPVVFLEGGNYTHATMKPVTLAYDVLFFGGGVFTDTDSLDTAAQKNTHTLFSKAGLCLIGAQPAPGGNGQATVLKRASNVRYQFADADIFIDNIVFDGSAKPPANNKTNGYYCINIAAGSAAAGFYMRGCTIQNFAAGALVPGVAINAEAPAGQVNLEKVTLSNVATAAGYANVQLKDCADMNIRDMTVILPQGTMSAIDIQQSDAQDAAALPSVSFSGYLNITRSGAAKRTAGAQNYIEVENYNTGALTLPDNYPYAVLYTDGTARLYQDKADVDYAGGALFDAKDQCWVVDQGTPDYEAQLAALAAILQDMNQNRQLGPDGAPQYASDAFIKLIPDASGTLKGFAIPDFAAAKAHIRALPEAGASFLAAPSVAAMVPFSGDASERIAFPAAGAGNVTLYGIDFDKTQHRTLQEVLQGGTADTQKPVAVGATKDSFVQCAFTGLAASLVIASSPTSLQVGSTGHAQAKIDSVYLANGYILPASGSVKPNDASVEWTSSNPKVATVDAGGTIQALAAGTITITAKAKDMYNQGELARPSAGFQLTVTTAPVSPPPAAASSGAAPSSSASKAPASTASSAPSAPSASSAPSSVAVSSSAASLPPSSSSPSAAPASGDDPSSGLRGPKWALANLILSLGSVVLAALVFLQYAFGKKEEESSLEEGAPPDATGKNGGMFLRVAILVAALLSVLLFLLTENLRSALTFLDRWTPVMLLFLAVQLVLLAILQKNDRAAGKDDTRGTDLYD